MQRDHRSRIQFLAAGLLAAACAQTGSDPGPSGASAAAALDPGIDLGDPSLTLAEPIQRGNLVLWPVVPAPGAEIPRAELASFLTLDQALEADVARVLETDSVNELTLINDADLPILLLSGEVLDGGKQDRIVARDILVAAGSSAPLASFCVEQSRWSVEAGDATGGASFRSVDALVSAPVRAAAQVGKAQGAVWSNVAEMRTANAVQTDTGTYVAVLQDPAVREEIEALAADVLAALAARGDALGFVAAVDPEAEDELVAAEVFGSAELFTAFRGKLVRAYVLDAVTRERADELGSSAAGADASQMSYALSQVGYIETTGLLGGYEIAGASHDLRVEHAQGAVVPAVDDPDLVVTENAIEAGNVDLKHLHRTIYKR